MRRMMPLLVTLNIAGAIFNLGVGFTTGSGASFLWAGINVVVALIFLKMVRAKF
jgi:hypothetical protein